MLKQENHKRNKNCSPLPVYWSGSKNAISVSSIHHMAYTQCVELVQDPDFILSCICNHRNPKYCGHTSFDPLSTYSEIQPSWSTFWVITGSRFFEGATAYGYTDRQTWNNMDIIHMALYLRFYIPSLQPSFWTFELSQEKDLRFSLISVTKATKRLPEKNMHISQMTLSTNWLSST